MHIEKREIRNVWVGYTDGQPYLSTDPDYGIKYVSVYPTKVAAQTCFEDVRKARIVFEPKPKRTPRR